LFSLKKEQNLVSFQKNKKNVFFKKTGGLGFLKIPGFFSTLLGTNSNQVIIILLKLVACSS